jgi:NADPH:quinone reductase-like Zn-dependent oxidoreductase
MAQAIQYSQYGGPEVLELVDVPELQAGPGQVRVAVRAVGVNPIEWKQRSGMTAAVSPREFPSGLGVELSGVIDQVGAGVEEFQVGDEVFGFGTSPTYAQSALAAPAGLLRKPPTVDWATAASLGVAVRTAYRVLELLHVSDGDVLLVHAAAGGVGIIAVQFARARGATVIGTASEANQEFVRSLGAIPVVYGDGLRERILAVAPDGVDAVLDASGRGELPLSIELAGGTERVITIAAPDAATYGVTFSGGSNPGAVDTSPALPLALELIASGQLQVPIWKTYPLAEAASAHAESQAGHLRGKIVLLTS